MNMIRAFPTVLAALLFAPFAQSQQVELIDLTLEDGADVQVTAMHFGGGARAASACDDFDRANNASMGPDWTEYNGDIEILNNMAHGVLSMSLAVHNSADAPYAGSYVEFDLDGSATSLVYAAAVIGYNPTTGEDIMVKIQNQSGLPGYNTYGFYHGNNGGGYGGWGGFRSFPSQITGGHVIVSVDSTGDVVTLEIDENYDGIIDYTDTAAGLLASGLPSLLGTQYGLGTYGPEFMDNWGVNGGCSGPPGPALSVSGLVAGGVATISVDNCTPGGAVRHAYSLFGGGPTTTPFGDLLLSPPYKELPVISVGATGSGSFQAPVPSGTTGVAVWMHAFDLGSLTFTNGVATNIG